MLLVRNSGCKSIYANGSTIHEAITMKINAELLAPAGDIRALRAAVINGADAVYLALDKFGARAKAENFTTETVKDAIAYAHLHRVKVYIAVNTILCDSEVQEALALIRTTWDCGADAFIVQDVGLVREIKRTMPNVILHASTQMGIHNVEGAVFAQKMGLKRIVLSRETALADIRAIKSVTGLEIEYFVHGALCVAFSGNCLLSSLVSGLSGNRGRCLQLCRKKYYVQCENKKASGYYLSPKDICLIERLKELQCAGVDSFKIEGRLRKVEYVSEVTRIYRKALDGDPISDSDRDVLKLVFNRGDFCAGYLDGNDLIYPYMQGHKGVSVGEVTAVRNGSASLALRKKLDPGDGVKFIRNNLEVGAALINGNPTTFTGNVQVGDSVCCTSSVALTAEIEKRAKKIPIRAKVNIAQGEFSQLTLIANAHSVFVCGEMVEQAKTSPLTDDDIATAVSKMGDTDFAIAEIEIKNDGKSFITKGALNALRRKAVDALYRALTAKRVESGAADTNDQTTLPTTPHITTGNFSNTLYIIENESQLRALRRFDAQSDVVVSPRQYSDAQSLLAQLGDRAILELPILANGDDIEMLRSILRNSNAAVCAQNVYGYSLAGERPVLAGYGLNIYNHHAAFGTYIQSLEAPNVLNENAYVYTFGYAPLMTLKHCPRKTLLGCAGCKQDFEYRLRDDRGAFSIRHYRMRTCYAQILNDKPILLTEELDRIGHVRRVYDFRNCDMNTISTVMRGNALPHVHFNFNKKLV